jgi:polyhydroxyalkanoate synthesis regulator phasin
MEWPGKRKLAAGTAAALAVAGGGAAIGATQFASPKEESQAVVADAAKQLGIEPAKLSKALEQALENRVDAAVAAGRLSKDEGAELKERIESGELPLFFAGGHHGRFGYLGPGHLAHPGPSLDVVATYLGLSQDELGTELRSGKTLAQIATAHGKTAEGLVQALYDAKKKTVDAAVSAGRLKQSEADSLLTGLKQRITDFVNGRFPRPFGDRHGLRGFRGFWGPAPLWGPRRRA